MWTCCRTGAGLGAGSVPEGLLAPSSGGDGGDVDCLSQEGLCHQTPTGPSPLAGGDEPGCCSLPSPLPQGQSHRKLPLDVLLGLCSGSGKTADGGGHCHCSWLPSCRHCKVILGDGPALAGFSQAFPWLFPSLQEMTTSNNSSAFWCIKTWKFAIHHSCVFEPVWLFWEVNHGDLCGCVLLASRMFPVYLSLAVWICIG